jgi:uncharacterized protein (TIGR02646 family)
MIRVYKSPEIPISLQKPGCNHYDGQDVQKALVNDQHRKCYLCEKDAGKDFQIEHLKPKAEGFYPELKFKWDNLFLACPYCNGRKPNSAEILDPTKHNIEEFIEQRMTEKEVCFSSSTNDEAIKQTVLLLVKLFNGEQGIRDIKCQQLYRDINRENDFFLKLLNDYKDNLTDENRKALIDSLSIEKEFLGFKYWIIKDYGFFDKFSEFMVWNKQP